MLTGLERLPEIIRVLRTDAIYACHAYLTRVPIAAIRPFVEVFTKPGEIVADFFAGSGMTGLAALSVNRRARLSDISVLGKHIARGYLTNISQARMREAADIVLARARQSVGTLYATKRHADGAKVEMVRTVRSFTYQCPSCCFEMVYFRYSVG
jgi:DNA modification methylase